MDFNTPIYNINRYGPNPSTFYHGIEMMSINYNNIINVNTTSFFNNTIWISIWK